VRGKNEELHGAKGNLGCKSKTMMALLSNYEERFGTCLPSWAGLPVNYHVQQLERKDYELSHCFSHNTTHSKHKSAAKLKRAMVRKTQPFMCCVVLGPQATHSPPPSSASDVSVVSRTCVEQRYVH
jgi:hypothetical protein